MFLLMLLLSRLAIKTALRFIPITVSTPHLTEKWDRSIKQHSLNILEILTPCLDCTSVHVQYIEVDIAVKIQNKIFCFLNERF